MIKLATLVSGILISSTALGAPPQSAEFGSLGYAGLCTQMGVPNARTLTQTEETVIALYITTGILMAREKMTDTEAMQEGFANGAIKFCLDPTGATSRVQDVIAQDITAL